VRQKEGERQIAGGPCGGGRAAGQPSRARDLGRGRDVQASHTHQGQAWWPGYACGWAATCIGVAKTAAVPQKGDAAGAAASSSHDPHENHAPTLSLTQLRRVLDTIRGKSYEEALMILEFLPYRAAEPILATLISAASNAKNNQGMSKARLYVAECFADQAGKLKRFRPRAKGRGFAIEKPISHLTIKVKERDQAEGVVAAADREASAVAAATAIQAEGGEE